MYILCKLEIISEPGDGLLPSNHGSIPISQQSLMRDCLYV